MSLQQGDWPARRDSNPRPLPPEGNALSTKLRAGRWRIVTEALSFGNSSAEVDRLRILTRYAVFQCDLLITCFHHDVSIINGIFLLYR